MDRVPALRDPLLALVSESLPMSARVKVMLLETVPAELMLLVDGRGFDCCRDEPSTCREMLFAHRTALLWWIAQEDER